MQCPKCGAKDTRVIDSRVARDGFSIRRRRLCAGCDYRFTTAEAIVRDGLSVIKRDGRREEFEKEKILNGLRRATDKRPIQSEQIEMLVSDVIIELENEFDNEIPTRAIGERIMTRLKHIDKVAYIRFACVYRDFADLDEFAEEISQLRKEERIDHG